MDSIYLDHAATAPVNPEVIHAMVPVLENTFGNPSSVHHFGRQARRLLDRARETMAASIHANEKEIVFTSGGTEADNLALIGTALANQHKGKHIITTEIEHHAILHAANYLEKRGFNVTYLPVSETGAISVESLEQALTEETILVSVMMVNNETGVIQPVKQIAELLKEHQSYFHTDAVQAYGTLPIDVKDLGVDLLTVSSHKINGPKGVGFLYSKESVMMEARQHGGEQERKRRPGTENVASIVGFQRAVELMMENRETMVQTYETYKQTFLQILTDEQVKFSVNGERDNAVSTIINLSFPGANVESLLTNFDLSGVAASSGSACTAGSVEPSHVLAAMYGSEDARCVNSIRFSFGMANTNENVIEAARRVAIIVKRLTTL
ncbi:cysteine desulfurase family protein [Aquibacillus sediminis]|uniref:cysteine desulfurase family protein n=1 Tax=Aquibacillus sediminis TaxID=2574734 RepID=UPI00110858AA|nr:cysteine desulfurase family protein [Aquibacillus sediminis]